MVAQDLYILPHADALWTTIVELRAAFSSMREKDAARKARKAAKKKAAENGKKDGGSEEALGGEFGVVQSRSLEECCGSFQAKVSDDAVIAMQDSINCGMPVHVEWNLVDGTQSVADTSVPQAQGGRKRSSTNSTINPRPRTKQRITIVPESNKENIPPEM